MAFKKSQKNRTKKKTGGQRSSSSSRFRFNPLGRFKGRQTLTEGQIDKLILFYETSVYEEEGKKECTSIDDCLKGTDDKKLGEEDVSQYLGDHQEILKKTIDSLFRTNPDSKLINSKLIKLMAIYVMVTEDYKYILEKKNEYPNKIPKELLEEELGKLEAITIIYGPDPHLKETPQFFTQQRKIINIFLGDLTFQNLLESFSPELLGCWKDYNSLLDLGRIDDDQCPQGEHGKLLEKIKSSFETTCPKKSWRKCNSYTITKNNFFELMVIYFWWYDYLSSYNTRSMLTRRKHDPGREELHNLINDHRGGAPLVTDLNKVENLKETARVQILERNILGLLIELKDKLENSDNFQELFDRFNKELDYIETSSPESRDHYELYLKIGQIIIDKCQEFIRPSRPGGNSSAITRSQKIKKNKNTNKKKRKLNTRRMKTKKNL